MNLYHPGQRVVESVGSSDNRLISLTSIADVLDDGRFITESGRFYDRCGLASPKTDDDSGWRSIRGVAHGDDELGKERGK